MVIDICNNIHSMNIVSTVDIYTLNNVQVSDYSMETFFSFVVVPECVNM